MAKNRKASSGSSNSGTFSESDPQRTTVDAASDAQAEAGANGSTKSKYQTMIIGVPKARKEDHAKLEALGAKLGCKPSALIWLGIDHILANPPAAAPQGSTVNTGSAAGFWTIPVKNKEGAVTRIDVREVNSRAEGAADGRVFSRYERPEGKVDAKSRQRARNAAIRAAHSDANMLNLDPNKNVRVIDLPENATANA